MSFRRNRQRQRVVGLYVERNVLYAQRMRDHPAYLAVSDDSDRIAFLAPVPIELRKAQLSLTGQPAEGPDPVGEEDEFTPVVPDSVKDAPVYWISVETWDGGEYRAWSVHPRAALRLHRQIQHLITIADAPARDRSPPARTTGR